MRKSFTIIEMLVILSILALISAISVPQLGSLQNQSRKIQVTSKLAVLQTAIESYYIHSRPHAFPPTSTTVCSSYLLQANPRTISNVLYDPFSTSEHIEYPYIRSNNGKYYLICSVGIDKTNASNSVGDDGSIIVNGDDICVNGSNMGIEPPENAITTAPDAPQAPIINNAKLTSLDILWAAVTGATSYTASRAQAADMSGAVDLGTQQRGFTNSGLANGTQYWYTIRAVNSYGTSAASPAGTGTTDGGIPDAPDAPTVNNITLTSLNISWTAVTDASSYTVQCATNSGMTGATDLGTQTSPFTNSGLTSGTQYWYTITAINEYGDSSASPTGTGTTGALPSIPGTPVISSATTDDLTVSWSASSGATSYTVQRATNAGMTSPTNLNTQSSPFTDSGLTSETQYWYTITAINEYGASSASATGTGTTSALPATPAAPSVGSATLTSLVISWSTSNGSTSYTVQRATNSGMTGATDLGTQTSPFTNSGLSNGTQYWYTITGINEYGSSSASATGTGSTGSLPSTPSAPVISSATAENLTVSWSASSGATSYIVRRATNSNMTSATDLGTQSSPFTDSGLANGTQYWYTITAINSYGSSSASLKGTGTTTTPGYYTYGFEDGLATGISSGQASTYPVHNGTKSGYRYGITSSGSWTSIYSKTFNTAAGTGSFWYYNPNEAAAYKVYQGSSVISSGTMLQSTWTQITFSTIEASSSTISISRLPSPVYECSGDCYSCNCENIYYASTYIDDIIIPVLLSPPSSPTVQASTTSSLTLSWPNVDNATSYTGERATNLYMTDNVTNLGTLTTPYTNTGLDNARRYYYTLKAVNATSTSVSSSPGTGVTILPTPDAPTVVPITPSSLYITWPSIEDASSYTVQRATNANMTNATNLGTKTSLRFTDSDLSPETQYWYTITAVNSYTPATSAASATGTGTTISANHYTYGFEDSATTGLLPTASNLSYQKHSGSRGGYTSPTATAGVWSDIYSLTLDVAAGTGSFWWTFQTDDVVEYKVYQDDVIIASGTFTDTEYSDWTQITFPTVTASSSTIRISRLPTLRYECLGCYCSNCDYYPRLYTYIDDIIIPVPLPPPDAPTLQGATSSSLIISWSNVTGATSYTVQRATNASMTSNLTNLGTQTSPYTNTDLSTGTTYYYRVTAANENGTSLPSASTFVATPTKPTVSALSSTGIRVSWNRTSEAVSYTVERATNASMTTNLTNLGTRSSPYDDYGLSSGTTYYYRVNAVMASGALGTSPTSSGVTP